MFYYFAYGILTNPGIIDKKFAVGAAVLENHALEFRQFANIVEKSGSHVNGVLWELPKRLLKTLDEIESYPDMYLRKKVHVMCKGKTFVAQVYYMAEDYRDRYKDNKPEASYMKKMKKGYDFFKIPSNTVLTEAPMNPTVFKKNLTQSDGIYVGFEFEVVVTQKALKQMFSKLKNYAEISSPKGPYNARRLVAGDLSTYFGDIIVFDRYHQSKKNLSNWYIEPDTTLSTDEEADEPMEIVSPPMPIQIANATLDKFYAIAKNKFHTSQENNTGLHINISCDRPIDFLKLAVFLGDEYLLDLFDKKTDFASSVINDLRQTFASNVNHADEKVLQSIVNYLMGDRDASFTLSENKKYISFRHFGGDYLQNYEKVKNGLGRLVTAINIACSPDLYKQEYLKKLYKLTSNSQHQTIDDKITYLNLRQPLMVYYADVFIESRKMGRKYPTLPSIMSTAKVTDTDENYFEIDKSGAAEEMKKKPKLIYDYFNKTRQTQLFNNMDMDRGTFERVLIIPEVFNADVSTVKLNTKYFYADYLANFVVTLFEKKITYDMPEYQDLLNFIKSRRKAKS